MQEIKELQSWEKFSKKIRIENKEMWMRDFIRLYIGVGDVNLPLEPILINQKLEFNRLIDKKVPVGKQAIYKMLKIDTIEKCK